MKFLSKRFVLICSLTLTAFAGNEISTPGQRNQEKEGQEAKILERLEAQQEEIQKKIAAGEPIHEKHGTLSKAEIEKFIAAIKTTEDEELLEAYRDFSHLLTNYADISVLLDADILPLLHNHLKSSVVLTDEYVDDETGEIIVEKEELKGWAAYVLGIYVKSSEANQNKALEAKVLNTLFNIIPNINSDAELKLDCLNTLNLAMHNNLSVMEKFFTQRKVSVFTKLLKSDDPLLCGNAKRALTTLRQKAVILAKRKGLEDPYQYFNN